jgi:hypothetical protein
MAGRGYRFTTLDFLFVANCVGGLGGSECSRRFEKALEGRLGGRAWIRPTMAGLRARSLDPTVGNVVGT